MKRIKFPNQENLANGEYFVLWLICVKESVKLLLRNVMQMIKKSFNMKKIQDDTKLSIDIGK